MSSLAAWLAVGPLGALGAAARFGVDRAVAARTAGAPIPLGTLTVNVLGAFLLGVLTGRGVHGDTALILGGAFLGAFTTFSTWMLDTHRSAAHGGLRPAVLNIVAAVFAGLAAAAAGWAAGAALMGL